MGLLIEYHSALSWYITRAYVMTSLLPLALATSVAIPPPARHYRWCGTILQGQAVDIGGSEEANSYQTRPSTIRPRI